MLFLIPALFDYVLYGVFFITGYRLAEAGANTVTASAPIAVWGIIYALSSPLLGKYANVRNAPVLLRLSGVGTLICSLLFMFAAEPWSLLLLVAIMGVISAFYCIPFQLCAGNGNAGSTPQRAAGFYTFSWSIGTAAGTFGFGCFPDWAGFAVNGAIGLFMVLAVPAAQNRHTVQNSQCSCKTFTTKTGMIPIWIFTAAAALCMAAAGALLPLRSVELQTGVFLSGAVLALLRLIQGLTALSLIRLCGKISGRTFLTAGVSTGCTGMLFWALGSGPATLLAGSFFFGLCGGLFYFNLVFSALSGGEKSGSYLGVNELILGLTGIAGPMIGGTAAQIFSLPLAFSGGAVMLLLGGAAALISIKIFQKKFF